MTHPAFTIDKDPDAVLDFVMDWSAWLPSGDTISSASVTVPSGITKDSESNTTTTVTGWISGGTAGTAYDVVYQIVTNGGRTDDRTLRIYVDEK